MSDPSGESSPLPPQRVPKGDAPGEGGKEGAIVAVLEGGLYRVQLGEDDYIVAHLSSSMRMTPLRLLPGDRVLVQRAALNPSRGRILTRLPGE